MIEVNKNKLFMLSCLSYAFTGALVIVTGIVMGDIAKYFDVPITRMSNTFTFLNSGILLAIFVNVWLMDLISLRKQLLFGFILSVLSITTLFFTHSILIFCLCMFVLGTVSGITMSIGTVLVTRIFDGNQRGARLLFTDSFFSMAGMLFPILAAAFISREYGWYWIYGCIGALYVPILLIALSSEFPLIQKKEADQSDETFPVGKWGSSVFILCIAAFCYILGQLGFIQWVPQYAAKQFAMDVTHTSQLVSAFWSTYMVGMLAFSFVLKFFDSQKVVTILAGLATCLMYAFISCGSPEYLIYIIAALGFFSSAIYMTIITLGSQQTAVSSPKLVNTILTCGTVGTMLTFVVTGPVVEMYGEKISLYTSDLMYLIVFICCFMLKFVSKHRLHSATSH